MSSHGFGPLMAYGGILLLLVAPDISAQPSPANPTSTEDQELSLENSLSLRDPFRRPDPKDTAKVQDSTLPELERYALDEFKLIGIITGAKQNKALVTAPGGKMHIIAENSRIGNRRGLIKKINPRGIDIEERVINVLGHEEKLDSTIEFIDKNSTRDGEK